ncbi:MAG: LPS export ABC transporter periplasmic protein LptC, partial [Prochlorothrix sp.]
MAQPTEPVRLPSSVRPTKLAQSMEPLQSMLSPTPEQSQPATPPRRLCAGVLLGLLLIGSGGGLLQGCAPRLQGIRDEVESLETLDDLAFDNITLEQSDDDGNSLWSLEARRATYQNDTQVALIEGLSGVIFQDGVATYGVEGETGQIYNDGERIVLEGSVVVTQLLENAVVTGDELEWFPETDRLILRTQTPRKLRGT